LGLGSSYRALGEYEKLKSTFDLFPRNRAIQVFYAMTLYNLKDYESVMELLLKCIADITDDKDLKKHSKLKTAKERRLKHAVGVI